ncbi:hypothetical protein CRM22_008372 [Opisthorchis felineus]|uniref:Saposin B-type domain-containing protein n=1 Tax=Opisthorchis felineus TaxID=147828 RepID=A0A4S2LII6_OPIFE|nr:hypothetical protein CRM22_008372 [Opisthorchis felineus]
MSPLACVCILVGICALALSGCDGQNCCQPKTTQTTQPPSTQSPVIQTTVAPRRRMVCESVLEQVYCELKFLVEFIGFDDSQVNCEDFIRPYKK